MSTEANAVAPTEVGIPRPAARIRSRVGAVAAAAFATFAVWAISAAAGVDLTVEMSPAQGPMPIGVAVIVATAAAASAAGWGLLAVLERFTTKAVTIWTAIAVIVLVLSFGGPLSVTASSATKATLILMHIAVAVVLVPWLRRTARTRRQ